MSFKNLSVFGCRAFVHIPKDESGKLDNKTKQCIFVGYGEEEYGYRLWDPINKKISRSRDVVFFENQTIRDLEKSEKPRSPASSPSYLDLVPSPIVHGNNEEHVQESP